MSERKFVEVEVDTLDIVYLSLGEIKDVIDRLISQYGKDIKIESKTHCYSDSSYLALIKMVPETDKEMEARIAKEKYWAEQKADRERKEFDRLKSIYG